MYTLNKEAKGDSWSEKKKEKEKGGIFIPSNWDSNRPSFPQMQNPINDFHHHPSKSSHLSFYHSLQLTKPCKKKKKKKKKKCDTFGDYQDRKWGWKDQTLKGGPTVNQQQLQSKEGSP